MLIASCTIKLHLSGVMSLKEKRRIVKSILARLGREYNVSIAEVDCQDVWQTAVIGVAAVGNDHAYLHSLLETAVRWIEQNRPDIPIDEYQIEFR